jgi:hypothetical protein
MMGSSLHQYANSHAKVIEKMQDIDMLTCIFSRLLVVSCWTADI